MPKSRLGMRTASASLAFASVLTLVACSSSQTHGEANAAANFTCPDMQAKDQVCWYFTNYFRRFNTDGSLKNIEMTTGSYVEDTHGEIDTLLSPNPFTGTAYTAMESSGHGIDQVRELVPTDNQLTGLGLDKDDFAVYPYTHIPQDLGTAVANCNGNNSKSGDAEDINHYNHWTQCRLTNTPGDRDDLYTGYFELRNSPVKITVNNELAGSKLKMQASQPVNFKVDGNFPQKDVEPATAEMGAVTEVSTMSFGGLRAVNGQSTLNFIWRWDGDDPVNYPGYGATIKLNTLINQNGTIDDSRKRCDVLLDSQSTQVFCDVTIDPVSGPQGGQGFSTLTVTIHK